MTAVAAIGAAAALSLGGVAEGLPLAHAGHWTWTLYIPPVAIVIFSIIKTTRAERRAEREERDQKKSSGPGSES